MLSNVYAVIVELKLIVKGFKTTYKTGKEFCFGFVVFGFYFLFYPFPSVFGMVI